MKLKFILHGFELKHIYYSDCRFAVCWSIPDNHFFTEFGLAFISAPFTKKENDSGPWKMYELKKL